MRRADVQARWVTCRPAPVPFHTRTPQSSSIFNHSRMRNGRRNHYLNWACLLQGGFPTKGTKRWGHRMCQSM